jgi:hypothetical protein
MRKTLTAITAVATLTPATVARPAEHAEARHGRIAAGISADSLSAP